MRFATLDDGTRDGCLLVVSQDGQHYTPANHIVPTLQGALDDWERCEPELRALSADLNNGKATRIILDIRQLLSPLPRAYEWVDGSAYIHHIVLVRQARNAEPPETLRTSPLVYQGGSGEFIPPTGDIELVDPAWGLDFEAEVAVVLGDTPRGTKAADAKQHVKLFMLCNDVTLRNLIPTELAKSFGFFNSKPASAFSPFAITPDELGDAWDGNRLHLPLFSEINGERVGQTEAGPEMFFGFGDILEHICKTRGFTAGTILGSGTVSNEDDAAGVSCLSERRMREIIATGSAATSYLQAGDSVRIHMADRSGRDLFGAIDQTVMAAS